MIEAQIIQLDSEHKFMKKLGIHKFLSVPSKDEQIMLDGYWSVVDIFIVRFVRHRPRNKEDDENKADYTYKPSITIFVEYSHDIDTDDNLAIWYG